MGSVHFMMAAFSLGLRLVSDCVAIWLSMPSGGLVAAAFARRAQMFPFGDTHTVRSGVSGRQARGQHGWHVLDTAHDVGWAALLRMFRTALVEAA